MSTPLSTDEIPTDDLIGRSIGHYEIIRELGRGGMATVYLARQTNMSRQVAIKILPREFLHDPQFIQRFRREVTLVAELEHPHILPVYDFGETDRIPFIVMRYLGGGSMRDMIDQGLPPLADLRGPIEQVCAALDFAHAEGIIHRDLKPSNIMLDERRNAYLSDFGIAQIMQDAGRLTGSAVIGTPAYMSPEQAEGRPLDARADVYAMGVVLFEMVTGREPYQADTPMAMLLKQISEPMPSPRAYRPDLPEGIERVIMRSTLKDPDGRYPSAGAFAEAFRQALKSLSPDQTSLSAPRPSSVERTYVPGQAVPDTGSDLAPEDGMATAIGEAVPAAPPSTAPPIPRPVVTETPTSSHAEGATASAAPRRRTGLWLGLAALLVIVIVGALLVGSGALTPAAPTPGPTAPFAPATPFDSDVATAFGPQNIYWLSIPENWQREDRSDQDALAVLWYAEDDSVFTSLYLTPNDGQAFNQAVYRYDSQNYSDTRFFTRIDEAEQDDGSLRISYRLPQPGAIYARFGPGQLDLFYYEVGPYFLVLEMFTADAADVATLLPRLQQVLDSVYVDPAVAWEAVAS